VTANTKTGQVLLDGLGQFIDDDWKGTTTSAGTTTTLVDTAQTDFGEDGMRDGWISCVDGTNAGETRRVTTNDGSTTITVSPAFSNAVASGVNYEFHRWEPTAKLNALDTARFVGFPHISRVIEDATVTTDGDERRFQFGGDLASGPYTCWREFYVDPDPDWNVLSNPKGDSLTNWTASAGSAALYTGGNWDRVIPKYDDTCTQITVPVTTAVSYSQAVSAFTGMTAANAAGRKVTFGAWVFALVGSRVTVKVTDDAGSSSSSAHQGRGWEFLSVEHTVDGDNATTLTPSIEVSSGAVMTVFWNRAWFAFGTLPDFYDHQITGIRVQRDGTNQVVYTPEVEPEHFQLKLVGRGYLTALGESLTATMEVDDGMAQILYAYAARVLFEESGLSSEDSSVLAGKIATTLNRLRDTADLFETRLAVPPGIKSPYFGG
jgi:hypothetical protein